MKYSNNIKADLHCHLNGCIPFYTITKLLENQSYFKREEYLIEKPVDNLTEYFKPWKFLRLLPKNKDLFYIMLEGIAQELSKDNIKYVELRNSIIYLSKLNNKSYEEIIEWFIEGFSNMSTMYNIDMRLIISVRRELDEISEYRKILDIIESKHSNVFVGFDLTGNESDVRFDNWPIFFKLVKEKGYGITIHAGESWNEDNVSYAINKCGADRIGHGLAISKNKQLLELCAKNDICIEVCLTSNLLTSSVKDITEHPVLTFHKFDVPYVLCSDNPCIHNKNLSYEYELFESVIKIPNLAEVMFEKQMKYSFKKYRS